MMIGKLKLKNNVILAPMAGVTDKAFRYLCSQYGCGAAFAEMVSANGLSYKNIKTQGMLSKYPGEYPACFQIFGNNPAMMGEVAKILEDNGVDWIDINMGCPAPKVVKNGYGSALMKEPLLAGRIIENVTKSTSRPVTVKMRSGYEDNDRNALEISKIAQESGAQAVTIHGRSKTQYYSGHADYDVIKEVKENVKIPVIGNGDIFTPFDAKKMIDYTKCDGIMVARGAQGNPFIFQRIIKYIKEGVFLQEPSDKERIEIALKHFDMTIEDMGEKRGVPFMRKHIAWYIKGMKNASIYKHRINSEKSGDGVRELLNEMLSEG